MSLLIVISNHVTMVNILRWTNAWQDGMLSLSFDRPPVTNVEGYELAVRPSALTDGYTYTEAMYHICRMMLKASNVGNVSHPDFNETLGDITAVEQTRDRLRGRIRTKDSCKTVQDRLEFCAFHMHSSFIISTLCRPALSRNSSGSPNQSQKQLLAQKCKYHLTETLRMYLQMHSLSVVPTRSWAMTHNGLSAALLLGILGETKTNPEVRELQGSLIQVLTTLATGEQERETTTGSDIELTGPHSRALAALRNIYDNGWLAPPPSSNMQSLHTPPNENQQSAQSQSSLMPVISQDFPDNSRKPSIG